MKYGGWWKRLSGSVEEATRWNGLSGGRNYRSRWRNSRFKPAVNDLDTVSIPNSEWWWCLPAVFSYYNWRINEIVWDRLETVKNAGVDRSWYSPVSGLLLCGDIGGGWRCQAPEGSLERLWRWPAKNLTRGIQIQVRKALISGSVEDRKTQG
jgi:hypothetical protein